MAEDNSTEGILKELAATVNALKKDIKELEMKDGERTYPHKRRRDGNNEGEGNESHDGYTGKNRDGDNSDYGEIENDGFGPSRFTLSEEGEAFLETTSNSRLNYKDRKKHITKYGEPDSKWTTCPSISPVVAATLPPAMRRKAIMQHLNLQLLTLMKDVDFKGTQPLLFGVDFGEKAKARMEAAAALQKIVTPAGSKENRQVFRKATLRKIHGATRVASQEVLTSSQRSFKAQSPLKKSLD